MKYLLALLTLAAACTHAPRYAFDEGPPRASCRASSHMAEVGREWAWACLIEGNLVPYAQTPIVIKTTQYKAEEFPTASVQGLGLHRVYNSRAVFSQAYYLVLRGRQPYDSWERGQMFDPDDPSNPLPPIGGIEDEFDGEFWIKIEWFEVRAFDGTRVTLGKKLTEGTVRGKLSCMQCAV